MIKKLMRYSRFDELHELIQECREYQDDDEEEGPQCLCLGGQTGAGKTTLVKTYAKAYPSQRIGNRTKIPVFYMLTPSPVTIKGMAASMLEALGDPAAYIDTSRSTRSSIASHPKWGLSARVARLIQDCQVELVILDDFQHLIDQQRNEVVYEVSDWLKVLIKKTKVPFLITGIDGEVERILKANDQLSRLFIREELKPFLWDESRPETIKEFAGLIAFAERTYGITLTDELSRVELLYRIHYATNGVMAYMTNLFRVSGRLAKKETGHEGELNADNRIPVTLAQIAKAYESRLKCHINKPNPFTFATDQRFVPPPDIVLEDAPNSVSKRGRRRKKRQPSAREILTTK